MNAHSPNITSPLGSLANEQREANLFAAAQNALDVRRGIKRVTNFGASSAGGACIPLSGSLETETETEQSGQLDNPVASRIGSEGSTPSRVMPLRDNKEAVLAALRELPTASALWVIETFAVKDLSDLGYGCERICDGIAEYRSDLADEAGI